ncbi:hypothetical protein ACHAW5_004122 [Stephanodiscus triporus]|uniref:Adenylate kinase n=1 Tax=Stephanodiscus triporus TaxID=2934178 RepID=A0ABD3QEX3_9STRA
MGTQSGRIVDTYKCVHLSVGELLRSGAEREDCPHAETIRRTLVAGNIVPVELSLGLLREAMDEAAAVVVGGDGDGDDDERYGSRIFLVDGFPRNYENLRGWTECMPGHASVLGALVYDCPMEELERRILGRAETSGRSDDNLESARRRFDTFRRQTMPVVRALERAQEMLAEADGDDGNSEEGGGGGFSLVVDGDISVSTPSVGRIMGGGGIRLDVVKINAAGSVDEVWKATKAAMDSFVKNDVLTANSNLLSAIEEGDIARVTALSDDDELLEGMEPMYDGPSSPTALAPSSSSLISNGRVNIIDGIKAIVSYDRKMKGGMKVRETRVWKHGPRGWKCVGVTRV